MRNTRDGTQPLVTVTILYLRIVSPLATANVLPLLCGLAFSVLAKAENHGTELRKTKKCQEVLVTAVL